MTEAAQTDKEIEHLSIVHMYDLDRINKPAPLISRWKMAVIFWLIAGALMTPIFYLTPGIK